MTIRRLQYHRYGGPEVMRLEEYDPPTPAKGQVLVRVKAAAANAMDWKMRNGEMRTLTGRAFPRGVGNDFAGVVEAVGPDVTRLRAGDAVLGATSLKGAGSFAELVIAEEKAVVHKPADLSYEQAATLPIVGITAFQAMVTRGELKRGQSVFVNGCLGGVGRAAAEIALTRGASVAGSCRSGTAEQAHRLGISPVVAAGFDPVGLAGRFDIVLDTPGTLPPATAKKLLKPGGRIIDIVPTPAKFVRSALPGPYHVMMGRPVPEDLDEVARIAARGDLTIPIARTVSLTEVISALTELERRGTSGGGKLIVQP